MIPILAQNFPGMEWIPVMLLFTVGGLAVGLCSLILRPFARARIVGRRLGFAALMVGIGSPLFFFVVVGDRVIPQAYALFATPVVLGLVARLIYPRRESEARGFPVIVKRDDTAQ